MKTYTDEEIRTLISCVKKVHDPPRKTMKEVHGSLRNDMLLKSLDDKLSFRVFMRINQKFEENFCIGLEYVPADEPGSIILLRYNGPHGEHVSCPHHVYHHIHTASAECINAGLKPERNVTRAENYAAFKEALWEFLKTIHLTDAATHFPAEFQMTLWATEEKQ